MTRGFAAGGHLKLLEESLRNISLLKEGNSILSIELEAILKTAILYNQLLVIRYLLQYWFIEEYQMTQALELDVLNDKDDEVILLITHGAKIKSALELAIKNSKSLDRIKLLLEKDSSTDVLNSARRIAQNI